MVILGISIGTRTSGIAILSNRSLVSWDTLSFKDSWSQQKGSYIISKYERYMKEHNVTMVVLKIPRISHHTDAIIDLINKIGSIIYPGCMVEYKTQAEIKAAIPEIKNSRDLMNHTATLYPILERHKHRELQNKNSYHDKMFEAVLVAHLVKEEYGNPPK
ncbi:hypothetical protein KXQ82_15525 [Mucilaginibacter sp. HMF5004]|uniref:hypothetical protein n=1 Tax=Mucilaginibacter rivuli TaxID=2857527 RepID=UPI001C5E19A3|nr:hypothetical protein [Mucilaginibacter rivuli]MBW4891135.1 hypothetical protein [Mucilaginibacter rivuli]